MKLKQKLGRLLLPFLLVLGVSNVHGQANDNPSGPAGMFNGNVATGCSYDPYTGNAARSVTDIVVAGAVGSYPLAFSRTSNSRGFGGGAYQFGIPGGWKHSYTWTLGSNSTTSATAPPTSYTAQFPDGRSAGFYGSSGIIRASAPGVRERLIPVNLNSMLAYLILSDGGKIEFKATKQQYTEPPDPGSEPGVSNNGTTYYTYTYKAQAIIDPYGLRTTLTYNTNGSLYQITEPAGRWIRLFYGSTIDGIVISRIQASDLRQVQYNYGQAYCPPGTRTYAYLGSVTYYSDSTIGTAAYTYKAPNVPDSTGKYNGFPLLSKAYDPMYSGPMQRIAYDYVAKASGGVAGQLLSERYTADGVNSGVSVSSVGVTNATTRTETRGDGPWRSFTYASGKLSGWTDFNHVGMSQTYDTNGYVASVKDLNGNTTNFTNNAFNGYVTLVTYPLTPPDTTRATKQFVYGYANCPDPNNRDGTMPYYLYSTTDELNHTTTFLRYANKRIQKITYPDGTYETFTYNAFGQVLSHQLANGGTESFIYNARGLKTYWTNAEGKVTTYAYDAFDRVLWVKDPRQNTTDFRYNTRGQLTETIHPPDPVTAIRYEVVNAYDVRGRLQSVIDENNHVTAYTYDEYSRPKTKTTPIRYAGDTTNRVTRFWYDEAGSGVDEYTRTGSKITRLVLPSGHVAVTLYDNNLRTSSITVAPDVPAEAAKTSYTYDNVGNVLTVKDPNGQASGAQTKYFFDERNRLTDVDDPVATDRNSQSHTISYAYDKACNKLSELRANEQLITYDTYDTMNRLTQQTARQAPSPNAVTKWTWWPSGKMKTVTDPRSKVYSYDYDNLNRLETATYPADSGNVVRTEAYTYDAAGNLQTFKNRAGDVQTFQYDNRNRETQFDWDDGVTVRRTLTYDPASNVTLISDQNASINSAYYNDNTLKSETEFITNYSDHVSRTVTYTYDGDGRRANMQYPSGRTFYFNYTARNQSYASYDITNGFPCPYQVAYAYDRSGNRTLRAVNNNQTHSTFYSDALNRPYYVQHYFADTSHRFQYAYDEVSNRKYELRDWSGIGDGFQYDPSGQVIGYQREGSVDTTNGQVSGGSNRGTVAYDASGNRTNVVDNGSTTTYAAVNNLNQYPAVGGANATYDANGNLASYNGWTYTYDAQNRLTRVTGPGTNASFWYDGLNRQCTRTINGNTIFSVWDGWDLAEEYRTGNILDASYLHGAGTDELVSMVRGGQTYYFYQDGRGNTSAVANQNGQLVETYKYDLNGAPTIFDSSLVTRPSSLCGNRFLFTGREYYREIGLYNYRNRFYSTEWGRFLQPDPIGFKGEPSNLYRYCGNNPANLSDPMGTSAPGPWVQHRYGGGIESEPGVSNSSFFGASGAGDGMMGYDGNLVGGLYVPGSVGNVNLSRWSNTRGFSGVTAHGKPIFRALPQSNIIGVLGAGGWDTGGNPALIDMVNRMDGSAVYRSYLTTAIRDLISGGYNSGTVIGYSLGGLAMVNTASRFPSFRFNLIGIDVVRVGIAGGSISLPSNVVSATNYYQQNPHNWLNPSRPFIGTPFSSQYINVNNQNWTGGANSGVTHINIVQQVHDVYFPPGG